MQTSLRHQDRESFDARLGENLMEPAEQKAVPAPPGIVNSSKRSRLARFFQLVSVRVKILMWNTVVSSRAPAKRVFDMCGSVFFMLLLSPIFIITYLLIKLQDGGPTIFSQTRVGKWGKTFKFYKFRSMVTNAEDLKSKLIQYNEMNGVTFKMKNDPRITPVGRIIRKLSIDELPQLWCVFKGDMSLVGPRPPLPTEVALYQNHHHYRLDTIPGITCVWQVSGRNQIQFEDQVKLDVEYIHKRSISEDIKLLFKTVRAVISAKGAS